LFGSFLLFSWCCSAVCGLERREGMFYLIVWDLGREGCLRREVRNARDHAARKG